MLLKNLNLCCEIFILRSQFSHLHFLDILKAFHYDGLKLKFNETLKHINKENTCLLNSWPNAKSNFNNQMKSYPMFHSF